MGLFDGFPFTNTHQLNLDWILREMKFLLEAVKGPDGLEQAVSSLRQTVGNIIAASGTQTAVELWRNAAPASSFSESEIALLHSQADCEMLMVLVRNYRNVAHTIPVFISREGGGGSAVFGFETSGSWDSMDAHRMFQWDENILRVSGGSSNDLDDDDAAIPVAVYGFNLKF